jgi:ABC-2 type transport system ATP-binding protein
MIEVEALTKYYGRLAAIRDVNFRVDSGEIVGFLGPNGAGKTTTMRILTCFSPASSGSVRILGMDSRDHSLEIRNKIGYLAENVPLYSWMRVRSYLEFVARGKGVPSSRRKDEVDRVSNAVGITNVMNRLIHALSKGYRQRVGFAQALIGDPPILVLDEPTIGLDPKQIREIRELIKGFSKNRTVILSSHILPEVSQVCDRVIIINRGTIIAEDTPMNLTRAHRSSLRSELLVRAPEAELKSHLSGIQRVRSVEVEAGDRDGPLKVTVDADAGSDIRPLLSKSVVEQGWDLLEIRAVDVSLEDVFIDLVTEEPHESQSKDAA